MSAEKLNDSSAELTRDEKIVKAKELYSKGSRNFLVKGYDEAADELSQVCSLYEEIYGELSDELGMPYLLYAKSLIALALDENKVIDVPEVDGYDDDDDDEEDEDDEDEATSSTSVQKTNGLADDKKQNKLESIKESSEKAPKTADEADSTEIIENSEHGKQTNEAKNIDDAVVTSTEDSVQRLSLTNDGKEKVKQSSAEAASGVAVSSANDKPGTSNGDIDVAENAEGAEEDDEVTQSLQLAWQVLELAAKIFSRQGINGLPNLAEVQTELANIQFENNYLDAAREDYQKALNIYKDLPTNYRRAKAEIHYKIGLTFLMQQINSQGAISLKEACSLIEEEIVEMRSKKNFSENDQNVIQDMEETKQEILAKIAEIEELKQQNLNQFRKVLDSVIHPGGENQHLTDNDSAGPSSTSSSAFKSSSLASSSSSSAITSSSAKPQDISHLIKRKKPDTEANSEAEAAASPAKKRPV